jgi:serine/threonine protein kinase
VAFGGRDHIGPYRVLKLVRAGRTTQVLEAINATDGVRVALKIPQPDFRADRDELTQLRHEYAVAKDLRHQNVIRVFGFNADRDLAYLVLEYFPFPNLKQAIRQDPGRIGSHLPTIVKQAADGLGYLHSHGWIHCDIKPDNYLVNEAGRVKLIDFSIAQREKRGLGRLLGGRARVQGTRSYMSPEQIRGETLDQRADIYSFGCMLYEIVGGRVPYTGTSADELLNKHLRAPVPSLLACNHDITDEFAALAAKTVAKKREHRPASIGDFLEELEGIRILRGFR